MTAPTVVEDHISVLCPELMAHTVIFCLSETGPDITCIHIDHPDSLLYIIPWAFVAEHGNIWIIWRKLKMT